MEISLQLVLRIIACVCFALFAASAVFAVLLYRRDDIKGVRADLSGKARQVSELESLQRGQSLEQLKRVRSMEESILQKEATQAALSARTPVTPDSVATGDADDDLSRASRSRATVRTAHPQVQVVSAIGSTDASGALASAAGFVVVKGLMCTEAESIVEIR